MKNTGLYGVAGYPILHSKSPEMFNSILEENNGRYIRISSKNPREVLEIMKEMNISGLNITTPLKESILKYVDESSKTVKEIGAVNTLINKDGKISGFNTDTVGVVNSFLAHGIKLKGKKIIVIGSGGAGRAAVYGLIDAGARVYLTNKSGRMLKEYSSRLKCGYFYENDLVSKIKKADIIVNTAPVNLVKEALDTMNARQVLLNADYRNSVEINKLNKLNKSARIIDGYSWLLYQGIASYKLFFNEEVDIKKMSQAIKKPQKKISKLPISMIGFMGAGKSFIGELLAKQIKRDFYDTDSLIKFKTNMSIANIFKEKGEVEFRNMESEILKELTGKNKKSLISFGGGVILDEKNRSLLKARMLNIWLWTNKRITEERILKSNRPLTKNHSDIEKLLKKRINYYADVSDMVVANIESNSGELIKKIIGDLEWV